MENQAQHMLSFYDRFLYFSLACLPCGRVPPLAASGPVSTQGQGEIRTKWLEVPKGGASCCLTSRCFSSQGWVPAFLSASCATSPKPSHSPASAWCQLPLSPPRVFSIDWGLVNQLIASPQWLHLRIHGSNCFKRGLLSSHRPTKSNCAWGLERCPLSPQPVLW